MAPQRQNPVLFEIIQGQKRGSQATNLPEWWSASSNKSTASPSRTDAATTYLLKPVSINRATLLGLLLVTLAIGVIGFYLGRAVAPTSNDLRSSDRLAQHRASPINSALMQSHRTSTPDQTTPAATSNTTHQPVTTPATPAADPRQIGHNYYCLATLTLNYREEAERAKAFLARNDVDARVIKVQNQWLQLIVMKGFESPNSQDAKRYGNLLRSLGRAWKSEHRGWSDWSDLYLIKHRR